MLSGEFQAMAITDLSLRSIRAYRYDTEANRCPMTTARHSSYPMWNRRHLVS
jgi:hypothetical protein